MVAFSMLKSWIWKMSIHDLNLPMIIIILKGYSNLKEINSKHSYEDDLWIRMQQGYFYRINEGVTVQGVSHLARLRDRSQMAYKRWQQRSN